MADARVDFKVNYDTTGAQKSVNKFGSSLKNIAKIAGAAFAVKKIVNFASESIELYNAQVEAETKLEEVMTKRIGATTAQIEETKKLAREQQKIGIFGDELIIQGQQQLATFASTTETVNLLTPAMNNLIAQQKGVNAGQTDFVNIANLMGKALQGQSGALTRVGISFSDAQGDILKTGTEMERAAVLAQVITDNVGDMNVALANTDAGQIANATNEINDMKEEIGEMLIPLKVGFYEFVRDSVVPFMNNNFIPAIKDVGKWIGKMGTKIDDAGLDAGTLGSSFITAAGMVWLAMHGPAGMVAALALATVSLNDDFTKIAGWIEANGGFWENWKQGVGVIWRSITGWIGGTNDELKKFNKSLAIANSRWSSLKGKGGGFSNGAGGGGGGGKGRGFASGGRPPVGTASMVGERGPEMFVPSTAGTIIPNNKLGGSSITNIHASFKIGENDMQVILTDMVSRTLKQAGADL